MPMIGRYSAVKQYNNSQEFTASGSFTVPAGVTRIRIRAVGGGGGAVGSSPWNMGGNGYFVEKEITVTPGQVLTVTIGAGQPTGTPGGQTSVGAIVARGGGMQNTAGASLAGGQGWGNYGYGGVNGANGGNGYAICEW